jgi:hypothetical protein
VGGDAGGERARVLAGFHRTLFARRAEVAALLTRENGKPLASALTGEVLVVLEFARFYAREGPARLGAPRWFTPGGIVMVRKRVRIEHEPYGVIGVISPWNYPLTLAAGAILPALVAGNAVVLKPSEFTPSVGAVLGELFAEAGLPAGVLHVVQGAAETGAALVASDVDKVVFTGSRGGRPAGRGRPAPSGWCRARWSSGGATPRSCSTTPTWRSPRRGWCGRGSATRGRPASRRSGSTRRPRCTSRCSPPSPTAWRGCAWAPAPTTPRWAR